MSERKGSLMHWLAECGHWMVVYSLEPTPLACPDCAEKARKAAKWFIHNTFLSADGPENYDECAVDIPESAAFPDQLKDELREACERYADANSLIERAQDAYDEGERIARDAIDKYLPTAERLVMSESA